MFSSMKVLFNLNSEENEKIELFSQGIYDFQNSGNETQSKWWTSIFWVNFPFKLEGSVLLLII